MLLRTKIPILATAALWLLVLFLVSCPLRHEFSHTYSHWIEGLPLPALTRTLSVPVLGLPGSSGAAARCTAWIFWSILWLPPVALAIIVVRESDEPAALRIWISWGSLYAVLAFLAFILVIMGLWLPFALL